MQLVRCLLQERYKFPPDGIVSLTEDDGTQARRPTRSNIEREFRKLAEQVEEGDQVVILLSGMGTASRNPIRRTRITPSPMESMRFSSPPT